MENFLLKHAEKRPVSFHMPGHKGADFYKNRGHGDFLKDFFDYDITEIEGADNLFHQEGIIRVLSDKYTELYGVRKSYLLINGTSCGLISAILSSVSKGGKLIMARNSHKSVFNAVELGGITPVYAYPEVVEEWGISGAVPLKELEKLLLENPEAEAVILPSPNYYGVCSDIQGIAELVHRHGKLLIVDQAHGAHLCFFNQFHPEGFPMAAERAGADIVVGSTHKTLASLTQSAVMNVCTDRVDMELLEDKLQMLESTSPSYILMGSLDINATILKEDGSALIKEWASCLDYFYREAKKIEGLRLMEEIDGMDRTKINLDLSRAGYNGRQLELALIEKHNIYSELNTGNITMCMTGIGNTKKDYDLLLKALQELAKEKGPSIMEVVAGKKESLPSGMSEEYRELIFEQVGEICVRSVIPYPPGIPLICPGESVGRDEMEKLWQYLCNGEKVLGLTTSGLIKTK